MGSERWMTVSIHRVPEESERGGYFSRPMAESPGMGRGGSPALEGTASNRHRLVRMIWYLGALLVLNFGTFLVYGWDKWRATREGWRVRESTLVKWALAGGWLGALAGMTLLRHKTRKVSFLWKFVPACLAGMIWTVGIAVWWAWR